MVNLFKGHPKGLYLLFFTEMWERFSYYGMRALLVIYCIADLKKGGLGWTAEQAGQLYGIYTGLFYVSPMLGGILADKFLGQQRSIIIGGLAIALGHFCLSFQDLLFFYSGIGFLVLGNGFFKPNISSLVGHLYPEGSPLKDAAYTIFYMGINIGAFLGILICGYLGEAISWHYGFGAAGVGMVLGLILFVFKTDWLKGVGAKPVVKSSSATNAYSEFTKVEWDRIYVIFILSVFSILFWMAFEQAGSSMSIFAQNYTDRTLLGFEIPTSWFNSLNPLFIFILAPLMSSLWIYLSQKGLDPSNPKKFSYALMIMSLGFMVLVLGAWPIQGSMSVYKAPMLFLIASYFLQTVAELCLSPIGLSSVNKLSPSGYTSIFFGIWFLSSAVGNYISGAFGGLIEKIATEFSMSFFFGLTASVQLIAGLVLFLLSKKIESKMHGVN